MTNQPNFEMDSSVVAEEMKEDRYIKFREQMQLDSEYLKRLEASFAHVPTTYEEYLQEVQRLTSLSGRDSKAMEAQLLNLIREVYSTSCIPITTFTEMLTAQGIQQPVIWAVQNIEDHIVYDCIRKIKKAWEYSVPLHDILCEYYGVSEDADISELCQSSISMLPEVYRNEDSPEAYLAYIAIEALQGRNVSNDNLNQVCPEFFSKLRKPKKKITEAIGEVQGEALRAKYRAQDKFTRAPHNMAQEIEDARNGILGEEYRKRYENERDHLRRRREDIRRRQQEAYERDDYDEYDDDDDYEYGYSNGPLGMLDRQFESHRRHPHSTHRTHDRDKHDISMKMSSAQATFVMGLVLFIIMTVLFGPFKGVLVSAFGTIGIYGLLQFRNLESTGAISPLLICVAGFGLAAMSLFL